MAASNIILLVLLIILFIIIVVAFVVVVTNTIATNGPVVTTVRDVLSAARMGSKRATSSPRSLEIGRT